MTEIINNNNNFFSKLTNKWCRKCDEVKAIELFDHAKRYKTGISSNCKACTKKKNQEYYARKKALKVDLEEIIIPVEDENIYKVKIKSEDELENMVNFFMFMKLLDKLTKSDEHINEFKSE